MKKHLFVPDFLVFFRFIYKSHLNYTAIAIIGFSLLFSGCVRSIPLPVSHELLSKDRLTKPIVENAAIITTIENPQIQPVYKIEDSIKLALKESLYSANVFGGDASKPFEISIEITEWSQPKAGMGMYASKLKTHYVIFDKDKNIFFETDVVTNAYSDFWYFAAQERSKRSATLNVAKNVNQFVDKLKKDFGADNNSVETEVISKSNKGYPSSNKRNKAANDLSLSAELTKLSELHSSGILTDAEFKQAKDKLLNER